jgi:hypothetical protein
MSLGTSVALGRVPCLPNPGKHGAPKIENFLFLLRVVLTSLGIGSRREAALQVFRQQSME